MQQRHPPPISRSRRLASAAGGLIASASGSSSASAAATATGKGGRLAAQPRLPPRTTKVSEKLVLLPDTGGVGEPDDGEEEDEGDRRDELDLVDEELVKRLARDKHIDPEAIRQQLLAQKRLGGDFGIDNEIAPLLAEEETLRKRRVGPERAKSYAERLPKARRTEKLARVTAYCTAQAYKMGSVAAFVKEAHGARTKLYDDCLYTAYHLPLLPGHEGYRLRSSPVLKFPGGRSLLDEEIERNELRDHHEDYMGEVEEHSVVGHGRHEDDHNAQASPGDESGHGARQEHREGYLDRISEEDGRIQEDHENVTGAGDNGTTHSTTRPNVERPQDIPEPLPRRRRHSSDDGHALLRDRTPPPLQATSSPRPETPARTLYNVAEMFVFSYGVVVFWNFTERQEKDLLADLAFATSSATGTPIPLATMPLHEEDFETEEFHFEYSTEISRPRVFNDMITLRSGDHMIKLAISHGISQSTKLCFFEEVMARQMADAKDVPRRLAMTGKLGMKREEVFRILGRLFKSRVEVNLCKYYYYFRSVRFTNCCIPQHRICSTFPTSSGRANPTCTLFTSLCASTSRSSLVSKSSTSAVAYSSTSQKFYQTRLLTTEHLVRLAFNPHPPFHTNIHLTDQTWIIIVLIIISILVTISEVFLRFGLLHAREGAAATPAAIIARAMGRSPRVEPSGISYSTSNPPPGCICPSIPSAGGSDMGMSGIMG